MKTKLQDLSEVNYNLLKESELLFGIYPEATGDYFKDIMTIELKILRNLLQSSVYEIQNLRIKLQNNEPEGWEGTRRRYLLKQDSEEVIKRVDMILNLNK